MKKKDHKKKKLSFFSRVKIRFNKVRLALVEDIDSEEKTSFSIIEVIGIIVVSILFGVVVGYLIMYNRNPSNQVGRSKELAEIIDAYQEIVRNSYDSIDEKKLSEEAIKGMVSSLEDPNSNFMNQEVTSSFNETVGGSFVGIGVLIQYIDEYNHVLEVYENSPAEKAGIKVDDIFLKVDGVDVKGVYGEALTSLVRGREGTKVKITVKRDGKEKTITVKRGVVDLQSVSSDIISYDNHSVGYIKITSFAENTYEQFSSALKKIENDSIDSLILDVRDNPGGHLQQVTDILSIFFPKTVVLYQIESKDNKEIVHSRTKESRSYPVMVLINGGSASASEILASCFQENYSNTKIIGNSSYGKGTIQKSISLSSGTSFKYTTQKWLTSKGVWINDKGVSPDIVVNQSEEYLQEPIYDNDSQLQEALQQIKES